MSELFFARLTPEGRETQDDGARSLGVVADHAREVEEFLAALLGVRGAKPKQVSGLGHPPDSWGGSTRRLFLGGGWFGFGGGGRRGRDGHGWGRSTGFRGRTRAASDESHHPYRGPHRGPYSGPYEMAELDGHCGGRV